MGGLQTLNESSYWGEPIEALRARNNSVNESSEVVILAAFTEDVPVASKLRGSKQARGEDRYLVPPCPSNDLPGILSLLCVTQSQEYYI